MIENGNESQKIQLLIQTWKLEVESLNMKIDNLNMENQDLKKTSEHRLNIINDLKGEKIPIFHWEKDNYIMGYCSEMGFEVYNRTIKSMEDWIAYYQKNNKEL